MHQPAAPVSPGRVLLVEDEEDIRRPLVAELQARGYEVSEARNGLHALQQLMRNPLPEVILLDMKMPVMTGFEFLDLQGEDPRIRDIPVIALTGHVKAAAIRGVRRLVRKPFDVEDLLLAIDEVVAVQRAS